MDKKWIKQIIFFLGGQTITLFGSSIVQYAISWHITLTTQSGIMLTIATLCGFLPQLLISLFAGVWADRYNRKLLIMLSDGMIAIFTALLACAFLLGYTDIWLLFVISAIRSVGAGIQTPAVSAFIPDIVPKEHLMRINGFHSSINSVMMLLAPVAAGGIYSITGMNIIFWVDVATAAIGISLLMILRVPPRQKSEINEEHFLQNMLSGFRYVKQTVWLKQFMGFYLIYMLMFGPVVFLTPLMVARSFGPESWRLVVHEIVFAAGGIIGGLIVGLIAHRVRNQIHLLIISCLAFALTTLFMGFSPNFIFYLAVMLPMGITMPFINTSSMTVFQLNVAPELLGRVFGLVAIASSTAMPLSMIIFGPIADHVSVELLLIITGAAMALISLCMFRFKEVIAVGKVK